MIIRAQDRCGPLLLQVCYKCIWCHGRDDTQPQRKPASRFCVKTAGPVYDSLIPGCSHPSKGITNMHPLPLACLALSLLLTPLAIAQDAPEQSALPPCCAARAAATAQENPVDTQSGDGDVESAGPVHALLGELEAAGRSLRSFTADVYYLHEEDLLGRREIRMGHIVYRNPEDANPAFAILFNRLIVGDRATDQQKHYIFADRWLVEIDHANRQFISREIVPPGRDFDPLRLGEGPIPLPIGQPRDEVLTRFDVTLLESLPESGPLSRLENVDGLRLVPKPGTPEARDFQHVDLYYDRAHRLPVGIQTLHTNDDRKIIRLSNLEHNPQLTQQQLDQLSIQTPDPQSWAIDIRPWRSEQ